MRRLLAVALAGFALVAVDAEATERWIAAYGDSITEGCCDFPRDGGYPERLAPLLGCSYLHAPWPPGDPDAVECLASDPLPGCAVFNSPGTCVLANRGRSNDLAIGGLTRLQDEVLEEWDWDVVVLMLGTNDIFGNQNYSIPAIKAALEAMDLAITESGADTLHAPIIEFSPYRSEPGAQCPGYSWLWWLNPGQAALRTEVIDIAATRNRFLSDQSQRICPNAGLDFHGHDRPTCRYNFDFGEKCILGHPSFAGYDNMADGFLSTFTAIATPGAPTPTAPSGALCGEPASFDWVKESNETATWYRVEIDGSTYDEWHQEVDWRPAEIDVCAPDADADDDCSLPSPMALGAGTHTWRLRGRHPGALSSWTATTSFETFIGTPLATSGVSPDAEVFDTTPLFSWSNLATANEFDLEVFDGSIWNAAGTFDRSVCNGAVCSAEPSAPVLTPGSRKFRVTTKNPCGTGATSAEKSFTVLDCASFPDNPLEDTTVTSGMVVVERACNKIIAGNLGAGDYVINGATADVSFHAGGTIELRNGFSVVAGSWTARNDG